MLRPLMLAFVVLLGAATPVQAARESPPVLRIVVRKSEHTLTLFAGDRVIATHHAAIGPGGAGPKLREGDRVTPVGRYRVLMRQPSQYRVFLRLDYPNADDRVRFAQLKRSGALPATATIGGDIGIHGPPVSLSEDVKAEINEHDWTLGCIAIDDAKIKELARLVPDGTIVDIED
jgi:murein L,D-transpeptidase YafK